MTREEALVLAKQYLKNKNLFKHVLAVEAVMKALAEKLGKDQETWALAGLLHDLDYEMTKDQPERHGYVTLEILKDRDVPQEVFDAILAHAGHKERKKPIEKAIYAADPVTGLIVAAALITKEKKLDVIDTAFVLRRFGEKAFARGANRDQIKTCEELGFSLDEFITISLNAMKDISQDLGL